MTIDTKRLREIAQAATPGPWRLDGIDVVQLTDSGKGYPLDYYPDSAEIVNGQCSSCGDRNVAFSRLEDAAFIAAANPQTVVALLDEIERLHRSRAEAVTDIVTDDRAIARLRDALMSANDKIRELQHENEELTNERNRLQRELGKVGAR